MNHKPTPQGEEMSKHPPHLYVTKKEMNALLNDPACEAVQADVYRGTGDTVFISKAEAQEMAEMAREEGRMRGRLEVYEEQMIQAAEEDSPGLIYWREKFNETYAEIEASKPSPQGGGEKKEGSK